jgi:hypothetical protein
MELFSGEEMDVVEGGGGIRKSRGSGVGESRRRRNRDSCEGTEVGGVVGMMLFLIVVVFLHGGICG